MPNQIKIIPTQLGNKLSQLRIIDFNDSLIVKKRIVRKSFSENLKQHYHHKEVLEGEEDHQREKT